MNGQAAFATTHGAVISTGAVRMTSRKANWALSLAVLGGIGGWLLLVPAIFSFMALGLGLSARRDIRARPELKGATKARVAIFLGVGFTVLWLLLGLSVFLAMSSGGAGGYLGG